jgi:hypothetical protein
MQRSIPLVLVILWPVAPTVAPAAPAKMAVTAVVETTLSTADDHIRQLAFDGDAKSYFLSAKHAGPADHFTLLLDRPVALASVRVTTGRPDGGDRLDAGRLEVSADGRRFERLADFADGVASTKTDGRRVRALRVRPTADLKHPLAVREFVLESDPPVAVFEYPVEFVVDVSDAPEMKDWALKAARTCERAYPMVNRELKSDGFKPPRHVHMRLTTRYRGVAMAGGTNITGSVRYFKAHPDDVGAMVHETAHVVQQYHRGNNPSWLVEGAADYVRFFKYEPSNLGRIDPQRARYNGSYRVTAAFLAYLTRKYDKDIVRRLNQRMREGTYKDEVFKEWTGKPLQELGDEWRASLREQAKRGAPKPW